ncbi:MAG: helix-turn-helix domain-containing protein [Verrucomicrobiae bacterium]|nr:helix-turn-helix domain-containing protein [Verrucomicrobiae bacterium]MCP5518811.1 helix-turn-helix transcriptional regulator [Verrucomicrobiales bacterium]MCP5527938.1 helix-turn-helix transcriptional regulator [Verrucomicrobiales bacterium]
MPRPGQKTKPIDPGAGGGDTGGQLCRRMKALRQERGWSLETLANASGVSRSMLSEIERGRANPTLAVACRIAAAFGLSLGELVDSGPATSSISVIRADDRAHLYRSDHDVTIRTLSPLNLEKDVEFYEVTLQNGGELRSAPHFAGTREFLTVHQGRVRLESGPDGEELGPGDSVSYRADVPHAIVNAGQGECVVFLVDIYR